MHHRVAGLFVLLILASFGMNGCSSKPANVPQRVPVTVASVERRSVPYQLTANGTVEPVKSVEVNSQVSGLLLGVRFKEGDEVRAGQVLFEIEARPFEAALQQAEASLRRDLVQAESAAREEERYRVLAESLFTTREDYQQKQAFAAALAATVRADSAALAMARLNLEYATIRAPIAGRTGRLLIHEGNLIQSGGTPLVSINQLRPIDVRFAVPATQLPELLARQDRGLLVTAGPGREDGAVAQGVLSFIDNEVDLGTGTVTLKAHFANDDGALWPGEFVQVTVVLDVQSDATVVPARAVMTGQSGSYVFVVNGDGRAEARPVTVARTLDTLAVISDGLTDGVRVVTDGQLRLTPNAVVDVRGEEEHDTAGTAGDTPGSEGS